MNNKKYIIKYRKMLQYVIPHDYPGRKAVIKDLQSSINQYIQENPSADYSDLEKEFGQPQELAASLLENLTGDEILHLYHKRKILNICLSVILVFLILCLLVYLYMISNNIINAGDVVVINDDSSKLKYIKVIN